MVKVCEVAEINPTLPEALSADAQVSFIPMSAISADTASIIAEETRRHAEVCKGYTPFVDGDVLFAKITPCFENGKIAQAKLSNRAGFGSTEFHVLRPRPGLLIGRYLLHFLRQENVRRDGQRKMTGSAGQRRVPEHFLSNLILPLPSLPDQRRIAEVLDKAEELRGKRRAVLQQLDFLIQSIFHGLFGDSTDIQKWPVSQLGELILKGPQNGLYKPACDYGCGTPILRIDGFYDGELKQDKSLKRLRVSAEELASYSLCCDDIVINRVNSPEYLGKSALIPELDEPTVFESNMMRFSVNSKQIDPCFLIHYLQTISIKQQIASAAKHAVNQSSINQQDVKQFRIHIPPIALQHQFRNRVAAVRKLKAANQTSLAELDALFASLQHRAFRGEL